jgi:enamine deaminase RidA (YjgF/YER057c/UK114 family)
MHLDARTIESDEATELYVCATPEPSEDVPRAVRRMFEAVRHIVLSDGARVCRQRVFVPDGRLDEFQAAYHAVTPIEEPAAPTDWLSAGGCGAIGGIQVHAVKGPSDWTPLRNGAEIVGWAFRQNGHRWAITGDVHVPGKGDAPIQATQAFLLGESLLRQADMDLHCVARTWFFLDDILAWYGDFNQARNSIFIDRGLLKRGDDGSHVPASTGMGVRPVAPGRVALELFAVSGPDSIKRYAAAGKQRSAYEYGSAFARAAEAHTPAGRTVFVSGTAAIDEAGATCHVGDIRGQVNMTIHNLLAVLRDTHCSPQHAVQAIAYCKSPQVAAEFQRAWARELPWPWVVVIGDVCRPELLFEAEVTVCQASAN